MKIKKNPWIFETCLHKIEKLNELSANLSEVVSLHLYYIYI